MIRKQPSGGYKLYSKKTGQPLSKKPKSFTEVRKQEAAIKASQARRGK